MVAALFSDGKYLLPFRFTQEEYDLHYRIDLNVDKDAFTLKVNNKLFSQLPWRPCAINIQDETEVGDG